MHIYIYIYTYIYDKYIYIYIYNHVYMYANIAYVYFYGGGLQSYWWPIDCLCLMIDCLLIACWHSPQPMCGTAVEAGQPPRAENFGEGGRGRRGGGEAPKQYTKPPPDYTKPLNIKQKLKTSDKYEISFLSIYIQIYIYKYLYREDQQWLQDITWLRQRYKSLLIKRTAAPKWGVAIINTKCGKTIQP